MAKIHGLQPAFKDYLWGGTRLKEEYSKKSDMEVVAESWELSTHPDGPSKLADLGVTLADFAAENPTAMGRRLERFANFPMLIKLIDAKGVLSVQVHPNDEYALRNEGQYGKTEMWYIVDASPEAYIYYGFKEKITKEEFAAAIVDNRIEEKLQRVDVKKGDCFFIPAGTIHAIGAGCLIAEVQQNSNVTYRVYDFNRRDKNGNLRELHIDKAKEVTILDRADTDRNFGKHIAQSEYFAVDILDVDGAEEVSVDEMSFGHFLLLEGQVRVTNGGEELELAKGDGFLAEAGAGALCFEGQGKILYSYVE